MPNLVPLAFALLILADAPQASKPSAAPAPPPSPQEMVAALETAFAEAIARAEPSVVAITRVKSSEGEETTAVRGKTPPLPEDAVLPVGMPDPASPDYVAMPGDYASGVVVGEAGEILTTYHAIKGSARIRVRAPGRLEFDAEVIAADPRSDLAVIAPRRGESQAIGRRLKPIAIGDATRLRKGSFLIALGNPYNAAASDGGASAGWGILANTSRRITSTLADRDPMAPQFRYQPSLLQLDAKLNLGMSGGAVINLKGELVGLTTTGGNPAAFDAQAGYAIPMDALGRRAVEALRQGKEVEYGFLGISLDSGGTNRVQGVRPGTPAAEADLLAGDEIIAVGDTPVTDRDTLSLAISAVPVGKPVTLKIRRRDEIIEKPVVMAKFPTPPTAIVTNRPKFWRGMRVDYATTLIPPLLQEELTRAMMRGGIGIAEVEAGSPAEAAGLRRGQAIIAVDGRPVRTPEEFDRAVRGRTGPITLTTQMGEEGEKRVIVK
ncbi:MAG: PDZ domain-containing protein [Isosphaeraceae bacterium]|nr:PDZ domain-containing protein [Isosphaeraceae bacterium]